MTTTPLSWLDTFTANLETTSSQVNPQITHLSNGNFLVVWADDNDTVAPNNGRDIVGVIYDATGNAVSGSLFLNDGFGFGRNENMPTVTATDDGGFVMAWEFRDGADDDIIFGRYNAAGTRTQSSFVVSDTSSTAVHTDPQIAVRPDGSTVVVYATEDSGTFSIVAKVAAAGSSSFGADIVLRTGTNTSQPQNPALTVLNDGRIIVAFEEDDGGQTGVEFRVLNTNNTLGSVPNVNTTYPAIDPDVAALANGGWVVTWEKNGDIFGRIYDSGGTAQGSEIALVSGSDSVNEAVVIGLKDGGFFVAWDNDSQSEGQGQRFDDSGNTVGNLITFGDSDITTPTLDLSGDGRILLGWMRNGEIESIILDPRDQDITVTDGTLTTATPRDTTITGSVAQDVFIGRDGDDTLNGKGGDDTITGGRGQDRILAGSGDDDARGGRGDDFISGSRGQDLIRGNTGGDELRGQGGSDVIFGGDNRDSIDGGAGNDILYGGGQADIVKGGAGQDTIFGGSGGDTIQGGGGRDVLDGGGGPDVFDFNKAGHSTGGVGRDTVLDFVRGSDLLDLVGIDANTTVGGNQAFSFIGTGGFTGTAGELRIVIGPNDVFLRGDVDGDGGTDFALELEGLNNLSATDILL